MDINTVIIIIEKTQQNIRCFNKIFVWIWLPLVISQNIDCIVGLKTIYSNIKFFIFQLICILAKMVITFEPVGIFCVVLNAVLRRTSSVI